MQGISLVIPFFNERQVLADTLDRVWEFLTTQAEPFELILADDGSIDGSTEIARTWVSKHSKQCRLVRNPTNQGRGSALRLAFEDLRYSWAAYIDADLEIDILFLRDVLEFLRRPDAWVVTGSKLGGSRGFFRQAHRRLATRCYNLLVHLLLHSPVSDHQCGLKGFHRDVLQKLLPLTQENGWAWDTEILLLAQKNGYPVHEFPVTLHPQRKSTVSVFATTCMFLRKISEFRSRGLRL